MRPARQHRQRPRQILKSAMTEGKPAQSWLQRWMWIAWPAFLLAGIQEMLVFALVDPEDLAWAGAPLPLSRIGIYSITFLVFWGLMMVATALTMLLSLSSSEVNQHGGVVPSASQPNANADDH